MILQKAAYLTTLQKRQLEVFRQSLLDFGNQLNLFSRSGQELEFLFKESLMTAQMLSPFFSASSVLDLGSGNGFPGLICGILYPKTPFILCERNRKKAEFLKQALFHLRCPNIKALCRPAEELEFSFSLVLSKATGSADQILALLEKILDQKGAAIFWKSPNWKKSWPANRPFSAQIFKIYAVNGKKRVLLQVKKKPLKCSM